MVKYCLSVLLVVAVGVWGQIEDIEKNPGEYCEHLAPQFLFENVIVTNDCFDREDPDSGVYEPIKVTNDDGTVSDWYKRRVECRVTCKSDGYVFSGKPFTVCRDSDQMKYNENFKWLPNNQNCTLITTLPPVTPTLANPEPNCTDSPAPIDNGKVNCPAENGPYPIGTICTYTCDPGYTPHLDNQTICARTERDNDIAEFTRNRTCCLPDTKCSNGKIVFVLDNSTSVGTKTFNKMKDFAIHVIGEYDTVGESGVQFGVVVYAKEVATSMEVPLDNTLSQTQLIDKISNYQWNFNNQSRKNLNKGTDTAKGLSAAGDLIRAAANNEPDIIVLLTAGVSTDNVAAAVTKLEGDGIELFAVGALPYGHRNNIPARNILMTELKLVSTDRAYIIDDPSKPTTDALVEVRPKIRALLEEKPCETECPEVEGQ